MVATRAAGRREDGWLCKTRCGLDGYGTIDSKEMGYCTMDDGGKREAGGAKVARSFELST